MLNIWALDKHQDIRHVLLLLREQLGSEAFVVDTETPQAPQAIYLCHPAAPDMRIWLHTLGQSAGHYGVSLEYPNGTLDSYDNLNFSALVELLSVALDVPVIQPFP